MNIKLLGSNCKLLEIEPSCFEVIINWRNDPQYYEEFHCPKVLTLSSQITWFEKYSADDNQIHYIMMDENDNPFGTIAIKSMNRKNKIAEVARLFVIKDYRGSTTMAECLAIFYQNAFLEFDILYGAILKDNTKAWKINKAFGWKPSKDIFPEQEICNVRNDAIVSCIEKEDFFSSRLYKTIEDRI